METMQDLLADVNKGMQIVKERFETDKEYQDACVYFTEKCERMVRVADTMLANLDQAVKKCEDETAYVEYASGCKYIHRGYYSPSPVFHLFVTGPKKGKLLKRMTNRSNPSFSYGFDMTHRLLWSKQLYNGKILATEYLDYQENCIYGITLDYTGNLQVITEELMENGKISSYTQYQIVTGNLECEQYAYRGDVVEICQWHRLFIPPGKSPYSKMLGVEELDYPIYSNDTFCFEIVNGELRLKSN